MAPFFGPPHIALCGQKMDRLVKSEQSSLNVECRNNSQTSVGTEFQTEGAAALNEPDQCLRDDHQITIVTILMNCQLTNDTVTAHNRTPTGVIIIIQQYK